MSDVEVYVSQGGEEAAALGAAAASRSEFSIEVRFLGGLNARQRSAFKKAADRWSRVIVERLPAVRLPEDVKSDGVLIAERNEVIDNLLIGARGIRIDGVGETLGQADALFLRPDAAGSAAGLPAVGIMEFDTADLRSMESDRALVDLITHEMGHVIGIGIDALWRGRHLLRGPRTDDPRFIGPNAMREYAALRGTDRPEPVPVEGGDDDDGTAGSHWRDDEFGDRRVAHSDEPDDGREPSRHRIQGRSRGRRILRPAGSRRRGCAGGCAGAPSAA